MAFAVVSGGGTGIGAATARVLACDGYDVAIVGRRRAVLDAAAEKIAAQVGRRDAVLPYAADLADPAEVTRLTAELGERTVDVLVNLAGGVIPGSGGGGLVEVVDHWRRSLEANLVTAVLLTTALLPRLARPGGKIILVSSIAAQRGGGGAYSAAKAALHGWMYDLAADLGPEGVTANVISPGYVTETEFFGDRMTPERHARLVGGTLVGRAGVPDDVAAAIRWLAGPGGGYVSGQVINVNGGAVLGR
jgi:3-oxoacyl-[acyl-carrier protein] reductase